MRIFITGASGFVGGACATRLLADGHEVVAMSRSHAADGILQQVGAKPIRCDLDTVTEHHLENIDVVIHCAAYVEDWGPKDAWYRANVVGTTNMVAAASKAGVPRFIHIGTEAAVCHGQSLVDADESTPLAFDSPYPYCATKAQAEQCVIDANTESFVTIVLRPRFIWGPGDTTLLPQIIALANAGKWMWIDHGAIQTSTTHIDNLVHGVQLALTRGRGGQAYYILDDGTVSMHEMLSGMTASRGIALPEKSIPAWLADMLGKSGEFIWRTFGLNGAPPLTAHAAMVMSRACTLRDDKARSQLGYSPVITRAEGLARL